MYPGLRGFIEKVAVCGPISIRSTFLYDIFTAQDRHFRGNESLARAALEVAGLIIEPSGF